MLKHMQQSASSPSPIKASYVRPFAVTACVLALVTVLISFQSHVEYSRPFPAPNSIHTPLDQLLQEHPLDFTQTLHQIREQRLDAYPGGARVSTPIPINTNVKEAVNNEAPAVSQPVAQQQTAPATPSSTKQEIIPGVFELSIQPTGRDVLQVSEKPAAVATQQQPHHHHHQIPAADTTPRKTHQTSMESSAQSKSEEAHSKLLKLIAQSLDAAQLPEYKATPADYKGLRDPQTGYMVDQFDLMIHNPPLFNILRLNNITMISESTNDGSWPKHLTKDILDGLFFHYFLLFTDRLSPKHLKFVDTLNVSSTGISPVTGDRTAFQTVGSVFKDDAALAQFKSQSLYRTDYPLQQYQNVCYKLHNGRTEMVFIDPHDELYPRMLHQNKLKNNNAMKWIPYRHDQQQFLHSMQRNPPNPDWTWIPGTTFHQAVWDFNVGHQFHQQVWSFFMAINSAWKLFTKSTYPKPDYVLLEDACAPKTLNPSNPEETRELDESKFLGVRVGRWAQVTKMFARIALLDRQKNEDIALFRSAADTCTAVPRTFCFENLLIGDTNNQFMEYNTEQSEQGFAHFRKLSLQSLDIDKYIIPFPYTPPANTGMYGSQGINYDNSAVRTGLATDANGAVWPDRPLRITVYTREDSDRRRLTNFEDIQRALGETHIVRHIKEFGKRHPAEQLALYATTDVLIAPHGAHMTFTFVLPVHAAVIEVHADEKTTFSWIKNLLPPLGIRHISTTGLPDERQVEAQNFRHMDRDFQVDIKKLCQQMEQLQIKGCKVVPQSPVADLTKKK